MRTQEDPGGVRSQEEPGGAGMNQEELGGRFCWIIFGVWVSPGSFKVLLALPGSFCLLLGAPGSSRTFLPHHGSSQALQAPGSLLAPPGSHQTL